MSAGGGFLTGAEAALQAGATGGPRGLALFLAGDPFPDAPADETPAADTAAGSTRIVLAGLAAPLPDVALSAASGEISSYAPAASQMSSTGIPVRAIQAYRAAAATLAATRPDCRLDWSLLAGIGRVESHHGGYAGSQLGIDGIVRPSIIGIALDGRPGVATIGDSDGGRLDGDTTYDRAVGPMQFIPTTWASVAADGDGDGVANPQDLDDAAVAAGSYLCAGGADLSTLEGRRSAVLRYNHSDSYVALVTALADSYAAGVSVQTLPDPGPVSPLPPVMDNWALPPGSVTTPRPVPATSVPPTPAPTRSTPSSPSPSRPSSPTPSSPSPTTPAPGPTEPELPTPVPQPTKTRTSGPSEPLPLPAGEPTEPEPTEPEPSTPDPSTPDPTEPEPSTPEPSTPDPTQPEPSTPDPTEPEPSTPEPTVPTPDPTCTPVPEPLEPANPTGDSGVVPTPLVTDPSPLLPDESVEGESAPAPTSADGEPLPPCAVPGVDPDDQDSGATPAATPTP